MIFNKHYKILKLTVCSMKWIFYSSVMKWNWVIKILHPITMAIYIIPFTSAVFTYIFLVLKLIKHFIKCIMYITCFGGPCLSFVFFWIFPALVHWYFVLYSHVSRFKMCTHFFFKTMKYLMFRLFLSHVVKCHGRNVIPCIQNKMYRNSFSVSFLCFFLYI